GEEGGLSRELRARIAQRLSRPDREFVAEPFFNFFEFDLTAFFGTGYENIVDELVLSQIVQIDADRLDEVSPETVELLLTVSRRHLLGLAQEEPSSTQAVGILGLLEALRDHGEHSDAVDALIQELMVAAESNQIEDPDLLLVKMHNHNLLNDRPQNFGEEFLRDLMNGENNLLATFAVHSLSRRGIRPELSEGVIQHLASSLENSDSETFPEAALVYSQMAAETLFEYSINEEIPDGLFETDVMDELLSSALEEDEIKTQLFSALAYLNFSQDQEMEDYTSSIAEAIAMTLAEVSESEDGFTDEQLRDLRRFSRIAPPRINKVIWDYTQPNSEAHSCERELNEDLD
ncbi:MAG: hypothetical protein AAF202_02150, partial [Pseudomonadota bacterium]